MPYDVDSEGHPRVSIEEREATFEGFLKVCAGVIVATTVILLFLAIVGT